MIRNRIIAKNVEMVHSVSTRKNLAKDTNQCNSWITPMEGPKHRSRKGHGDIPIIQTI